MEVRHLQAVLAVAEELHFGRAATRLHVAQPHLSNQIRQLERELGEPLFVRSTRSVSLTPAGEAFLEPARNALKHLEQARHAVLAVKSGALGRVTVGFAGAKARVLIPRLSRSVNSRFPGIMLDFEGGQYSHDCLTRVVNGSLDIGIIGVPCTAGAPAARPSGLGSMLLWREPLACVMGASHSLASRKDVRLSELANEPFVSLAAGRGSAIGEVSVRVCEEAGFMPNVVQESNDEFTVLTLVAAGVGVSIMPIASCEFVQQSDIVWWPIKEGSTYQQALLIWDPENISAATHSVVDIVRELVDAETFEAAADTPVG